MPLTPEQAELRKIARLAASTWPYYQSILQKRATPAAILALLDQLEAAPSCQEQGVV